MHRESIKFIPKKKISLEIRNLDESGNDWLVTSSYRKWTLFIYFFSLLNEMELQTLQLMEDDAYVTEQDLFSRIVENTSSFTKMITLMGQKYLLPPKSSFLLSDISCMHPLLNCK